MEKAKKIIEINHDEEPQKKESKRRKPDKEAGF